MLFLPRRFRIACFCIVTPFQIGIILTANYAFLNYLRVRAGIPAARRPRFRMDSSAPAFAILIDCTNRDASSRVARTVAGSAARASMAHAARGLSRHDIAGVCLGLIFYVTWSQLVWMLFPGLPFPQTPMHDA